MLEFILGVIAGAAVGWKIASWLHMGTLMMIFKEFNISEQQILQALKKEGIEVDDEVMDGDDAVVMRIKVEQHGDQLYAYTVDDDVFVAQGFTAEDLSDKVLKTMPLGGSFTCRSDEGGKFFTLTQK